MSDKITRTDYLKARLELASSMFINDSGNTIYHKEIMDISAELYGTGESVGYTSQHFDMPQEKPIRRIDSMQNKVQEFMVKMDQVRGNIPEMRDHMLRFRLIWEESHELCDAILSGDFVGSIDGMCDLLYVVLGTAEAFGIDIVPYFNEVHRTNMLKEKGIMDRWGKIIKPEGWQPPNISAILDREIEDAKR